MRLRVHCANPRRSPARLSRAPPAREPPLSQPVARPLPPPLLRPPQRKAGRAPTPPEEDVPAALATARGAAAHPIPGQRGDAADGPRPWVETARPRAVGLPGQADEPRRKARRARPPQEGPAAATAVAPDEPPARHPAVRRVSARRPRADGRARAADVVRPRRPLRRAAARDQRIGVERDRRVAGVRHLVGDGEHIVRIHGDGAFKHQSFAIVPGQDRRAFWGQLRAFRLPNRIWLRNLYGAGSGPPMLGVVTGRHALRVE